MKKLTIVIFLFIAKGAFAQKDTVGLHIPVVDGGVVYERVFQAPGKSKSELYNNAQLWFVKHYGGADCVQMADRDMARVVGRGFETINFKAVLGITVDYNDKMLLQIDCKDGKYRVRVYHIILESQDPGKDKVIVTPEDLLNILEGKGSTFQFTKAQARRVLDSLNTTTYQTMTSLNSVMSDGDDF